MTQPLSPEELAAILIEVGNMTCSDIALKLQGHIDALSERLEEQAVVIDIGTRRILYAEPELTKAQQQLQSLMAERDALIEQLEVVRVENAQIADDVRLFVPGQWYCPKCQFALSRQTLSLTSGTVGVTRADIEEPENCPNDGTEMLRETWQQRAEYLMGGDRVKMTWLSEDHERQSHLITALEAERDEFKRQLEHYQQSYKELCEESCAFEAQLQAAQQEIERLKDSLETLSNREISHGRYTEP